ncbi:MAG: hypothetical protein O7C98_16035 [Planctomycetota bacterium]|nr:hypothetical protein [Planctomycetota bacterium]
MALVRVGSVEEIREAGCKVVSVGDAPVLVLSHDGSFSAIDNRLPPHGVPAPPGRRA